MDSQTILSVDQVLSLPNIKNAIESSEHTIIILRGLSGSGKSTVAKKIKELYGDIVVICSADKFFITPDGKYEFDPHRLSEVHQLCKESVLKALANDGQKRVVVVDNTHSSYREYSYCDSKIFQTFILEFVCSPDDVALCASRTTHSVPIEVIQRMYNRWYHDPNSIKMSLSV